jgi:hypothetical protein
MGHGLDARAGRIEANLRDDAAAALDFAEQVAVQAVSIVTLKD